MAFAPVPDETKSQINRAGAILSSQEADPSYSAWALELAERWRACHAYPINTFQATLRANLRSYEGDPIAAQRLKRMPTIVDKLKRYPAMKLTTMQDIGGVRAVLSSVEDVRSLAHRYMDSRRFAHKLTRVNDYITNPRGEDGYRSIHLIYSYRNKRISDYDGLRIELQIRTRLQHIWATAVESMGTFLGQALKSRRGEQKWLDFFAVVSSAFAHEEGTAPVPPFAHLSREETSVEVARAEAGANALNMMSGLSIAANEIHGTKSKASFYHVIELNSEDKTVQITPYDRDSFEKALLHYAAAEELAARGERIEPVLVSAGPVTKLRRAYPNFFLDITEFVDTVRKIVASVQG